MMIRYRVTHTTEYRYSTLVSQCQNEARLLPRATLCQRCGQAELRVQPAPALRQDREDFFGNRVSYFAIQEPHTTLSVVAVSEVQIMPPTLLDLSTSPA